MRVAVILVHYRTPDLAAAAIEALRRDADRSGLEIEGLLIDNGSDETDRARLAGLGFERIDPGANLGYAGGVNLGVARSRSETLVLMNPDVRVLPGCLATLAETLAAGSEIAGPRFYWDETCRLVLPPAEERSRTAELLALLAGRAEPWAVRARRRWRRHARRHWEASQPVPSYALSGGLLALRRDAWRRVGPFDERFRLYFEETDWLRRAERLGLPAAYVPAAAAVHLHARSTAQEPRSEGWFVDSARRFRERHYGSWFARLMERLALRPPVAPAPPASRHGGLELGPGAAPAWVEVSPNAVGFPAAAERLTAATAATWRLPGEIARRLAGADLALQVVDARGRELGRFTLRPELQAA